MNKERLSKNILNCFSELNDGRMEKKVTHKLIDIIVITLCAVISGADCFTEIEEYGKSKSDWLKTFLELKNGIPSHDTFNRVFAMMSAKAFGECFLKWVNEAVGMTQGEVVAIDGKTLRRSYDKGDNKAAIHMVSAWASANRLILGQIKTQEKSNEITAIPELLNLLEIKGCIVTIDAMGTQKAIADTIVKKEADYALALKANQEGLHHQVKTYFEQNGSILKDIENSYYESIEENRDRMEIRRTYMTENIEGLKGKEAWTGLKSIGMVESLRFSKDGYNKEIRYYITSLSNNASQLADAVRNHWGIENKVHWVLDTAFREDECRVRKGSAAENLSVIRRMAINLISQDSKSKGGKKAKRLRAGWDNDYLLSLIKLK